MKTIILTGGGTAGHVFGNIALLPKLQTYFNKIIYVGSENGIEKEIVSQYPQIEYIPIKTIKFIRKFTFKNLLIPFILFKSINQCKNIISKTQPNIIFSKGGYVSIPIVIAGHKKHIPIIQHESDLSLGLANKITRNKAKCICTTFEKTANKLTNGLWTGSPIRDEILNGNKDIKNTLNISHNIQILLVVGGSLGATTLNNLVWDNIDFLCSNFFVIHITGKNKANYIKHHNYIQMEYSPNIQDLLSIADFAITRGGSNAINEFLALNIPMLIIPLSKKISRGDQIQNAQHFEKQGYSITLYENDLNNFKNKVNELITKKDILKNNMQKAPANNALNIIFNQLKKYVK